MRPGGRQGARNAIGATWKAAGAAQRMRVAREGPAAEFAANILLIIRMTGISPVAVRCPRMRDRVNEGSERIRFSSAILPPYAMPQVPDADITSPNSFQVAPSNFSSCICLMGAKSVGLVESVMPGSNIGSVML
jgi:hypothetical protein